MGILDTGRVEEGVDLPAALIDGPLVVPPLLLLVPVPSDDRRQPGVHRHPVAPSIELREALHDHRRSGDVVLEPLDPLAVPDEIEPRVHVAIVVRRRVHEGHPVSRGRDAGVEPVSRPDRRGHDGVDEDRGYQRRHERLPSPTEQPGGEDPPETQPPQGIGRGDAQQHPCLEIELEDGVHPADVVGEGEEVHHDPQQQGHGDHQIEKQP